MNILKLINHRKIIALILLVMLIFSCDLQASEHGTFEGFYTKDFDWTTAILVGTAFAIVSGLIIFFTAGTGTGVVASIGTLIGNAMGLSGAAATNAGLALIGGGAISAGGLGVAGGTAILSSVLGFGSGIAIDYGIDSALNYYDYHNLVENSKNKLTLPLPLKKSGTKKYEKAVKELAKINKKIPFYALENKDIITKAGKIVQTDNTIQGQTLLAYLYFVSNDYKNVQDITQKIINKRQKSKITLVHFMYAISLLYEKNSDGNNIHKHFETAVLNEVDNKLIPLLFAIYLDRIILTQSQNNVLNKQMLSKTFVTMKNPKIKKFRKVNYPALIVRYIGYLNWDKLTIETLVISSSEKIQDSTITVKIIKEKIENYKNIINLSEPVAEVSAKFFTAKKNIDNPIETINKHKDHILKLERFLSMFADIQAYKKLRKEWAELALDYQKKEGNMIVLRHENKRIKDLLSKKNEQIIQQKNQIFWLFLFGLFILLLILFYLGFKLKKNKP